MTPLEFGVLVGRQKRAEEIHPLQSPAAGYRDEMFRQHQLQQQQAMAQQQQEAQQQAANLPQGPTAANYPNIAPAVPLQPTDPAAAAQKAAALRGMDQVNAAVIGMYAPDLLKQASFGGILRGLGRAAGAVGRGAVATAKAVPAAAKTVGNFGKGVYATTKPITGLATGGLKGMGKGFHDAGRLMYSGGKLSPAAMAGAGLTAYTLASSLQNPVFNTGDGVQLRSPIRIPAVRVRSPIVYEGGVTGGGVRLQNPIKRLW